MKLGNVFLALAVATTMFGATTGVRADDHPGHSAPHYMGKGTWMDQNGNTMSYDAEFTYDGHQLVTTIKMGGQTHQSIFEIREHADGTFDMYSNGKVGEGRCDKSMRAMQCHYWAQMGGAVIEESITFNPDGVVQRTGSRTTASNQYYWNEILHRCND